MAIAIVTHRHGKDTYHYYAYPVQAYDFREHPSRESLQATRSRQGSH